MNIINRSASFALCLAVGSLAHAQSTSLSRDLHEISNLKSFKKTITLDSAHLAALHKNWFFTTPSDNTAMYWVYGNNDYREIPSLVTTDNVLQIYHTFFESTLRGVEEKSLAPELKAMTQSMLFQAGKTMARARADGSPLEKAALKNLAYFGVAAELLGNTVSLPAEAQKMVDAEVKRIATASGRTRSAIFPYDVDYSQFIVRGHYTRTPVLSHYFKAMMWFGLMPFSVAKTVQGTITPVPEQVQQALLLADDLETSGASKRWKRIYDVTSLFAGKSNNLTPLEWRATASKVFKSKADYTNPALLKAFVIAISKLRRPAIVLKLKDGTNPSEIQLRFMGQRAIPDSIILQRLSDPDKRPFPSPLDIFAVLGSPSAKSILDTNPQKYNPKAWSQYLTQRRALESEFAKKAAADWSQDLYWSWLDSLRTTIRTAPSSYPKFMKSDAWGKKALYSALGSWAELRHDTILYGMQSATEMGDGDEPTLVRGYVEPNVAFYQRILALMNQTSGGLKSRGYLSTAIAEDFKQADDLIRFLLKISQKELAHTKLTKDEYNQIRFIEGELEYANIQIQRTVTGYETLTEDDLDMALVADIHTAYGKALTVGVGRADHIFAVVPIEGNLVLTRGSSLSYYEFLVPASQRMTDEAWKKQLRAGKFPPRPDWVKSFYVPKAPKVKTD